MKRAILRSISVHSCWIFIIICTNSLWAQVRSDRAIVDAFENKVKVITQMIEKATTVQECAEVASMIDELEKENLPNKELLNRALYPDDFTATFTNLRGRLLLRQKDIGVIESQYRKIVELERQVQILSGTIDSLSRQNETLLKAAKALATSVSYDAAHIDSLTRIVAALRRGIQERDQLIFTLLDSIFVQYDKDVTTMSDVEKRQLYGKLERRNVLTNIRKAVVDNILFLEATTLTPTDYSSIMNQQKQFHQRWNALSPSIERIYFAQQKKHSNIVQIDSLLQVWDRKIETGVWQSLQKLFSENGYSLAPFHSGEQFLTSLTAFVDSEIQNVNQYPQHVRIQRYQDFEQKIWEASLAMQWLPMLVETQKISEEQRTALEKKVAQWKASVKGTPWGVYIVVGLLIVLASILVIRLLLQKKRASLKV